MIFVTVGTQFPFDRLVRAVDEAAGKGLAGEEFFAQVGVGGYRAGHMTWAETIERQLFQRYVSSARAIVGHAGVGTIVAALEARKPILVMPRRRSFGELVNDHQVHTARRFEALGQVLVAWSEHELAKRLVELRDFVPKPRKPNVAGVVDRVRRFLEQVEAQRKARW